MGRDLCELIPGMRERLNVVREIALHHEPALLRSERLIVLQYSHPLVYGLPSHILAERLRDSIGTIRGGWDDDAGTLLVDEVRPHHVKNGPNLNWGDAAVNVYEQKRASRDRAAEHLVHASAAEREGSAGIRNRLQWIRVQVSSWRSQSVRKYGEPCLVEREYSPFCGNAEAA